MGGWAGQATTGLQTQTHETIDSFSNVCILLIKTTLSCLNALSPFWGIIHLFEVSCGTAYTFSWTFPGGGRKRVCNGLLAWGW